MKRLNCTWRQQKASSTTCISKKGIDNGPVLKAAPGKRRLGRIAIAVSNTVALDSDHQLPGITSSSSKPDKQESFLSSFSVNNDLMEEMDKVEAAMKQSAASLRKVERVTTTSEAIPSDKSDSCLSKDLVTNVSSARGLVKRQRSQILPCKAKDLSQNLMALKKIQSPSNSPLDKKQRLLRRDTKKSGPVHYADAEDNFVETNAQSKKRAEHCDNLNSKIVDCIDISFSPLITTPDITPNPKCHSEKASDITETPKRPRARKRSSPKYTKSPVVKAIRANSGPAKHDANSTHNSHKAIGGKIQGGNSSLTEIISPVAQALFKEIEKLSDGQQLTSDATSKPPRYGDMKAAALAQQCEVNHKESSSNEISKGCIRNRAKFPANTVSTTCEKSNVEEIKKSDSANRTLNGSTSTLDGVSTSVGDASGNTSLTEDKRMLSSWGLPKPVLDAYASQGVSAMFEWQAECLLAPGVLEGGNLVYSAPTSAGKTLVAELLVLKRVVETRKKALIILPFVSVAREKMFSLKRLYQDAGIKVGGYMGSYSPAGGLSALDVAVCTIEKGNGLVNRLMEDGRIEDIGVVVVDELHMIGDSHRGYLLELMLTKLSYMSCKNTSQKCLQIIGMSATLPNLEVLSKWLNAALYRTEFRPVPLSEHLKVDTYIYDDKLSVQGRIPGHLTSPEDADHIIALCLETILGGHSVLLFCPTKNWCEKLCETIARKFYELTHSAPVSEKDKAENSSVLFTLNKDGLRESIEQLKRCPVGVDHLLGKCLLNGVAYHHAGLTFDERDIIEGAFRQGSLRVLVATSTLSSGVNLPARRVIIRTPMFHGKVLDTLTYKQMSGRAGRKGVDTEGESILVCKANEKMKGKQLLQSDLPPVKSCLYFEEEDGLSRSLKRAILEVVVSGVASCPSEVMSYINCTLLSASLEITNATDGISSLMDHCIQFLEDNEFVSMQTITNEDGSEVKKFFPTQLGSAILASSMSPDEGILVFSELQKARRSFVLETDLHVIYLVTPVYVSDISASIDWYHFYTLWEGLTPADRRVAELVGVSEAFIARAISGRIYTKTHAQKKSLTVHQRFYTALVLNTLVQEVPLMEVAARFSLNKGQLQSLQQSAATYAGMVTVFSGRLGWHSLEAILSDFQRRLSLGVQHELVDLVRISALNASSARMLYNAGYISVTDVALADPIDVENLFKKAVPFQSEKKQEGETEWERQERCKARCIWLTGRKGMTEFDAALAIIEEAKLIIEGDVGVKAIVWSSKESGSDDSDNDMSENGEGGSNKENKGTFEIVDRSLATRTRNELIKSSEAIENVSYVGLKTPCNHRGSGFTQLKTRRSRDETPLRPSSSSRRNRSFLKSRISNHADSSSSPSNMTPSCVPQEGESSFHRKISQRSGRVKGQGGDKSVLKERSIFGQVVVSPPPGISPKYLQHLAQSSNIDGLNVTKLKSKNPLNEANSLSQPKFDKKKEMDCPTNKLNSGQKTCKNNDQVGKEKVNEIEDGKKKDVRGGPKILGNLSTHQLTSVADLKYQKKTGCHEEVSPTSRMRRADNDSLDISPNIFGDSPRNDYPSEVEEKEKHEHNCMISKKVGVDSLTDGDPCNNNKYNPEISKSNGIDCSFSSSFVLDTQTVNIINEGIQIDGHKKSPALHELQQEMNSRKSTGSSVSNPSKEPEVCRGDNETRKPQIRAYPDVCTEDSYALKNKEYETNGTKKYNSSKLDSMPALGPQDQITSSYHTNVEEIVSEHNLPSSKCIYQMRVALELFQNADTDPYSSLVAASDYANAANFDEGMLELSTVVDEGESKSPHQYTQRGADGTRDGIFHGTFDKISEFSSPESINQVSDTQRSDDSLLAAVAMPNCYPLSPVVHVNITALNDKKLDTTENLTRLKANIKNEKNLNILSPTHQTGTNISKDDPPQDLLNLEDDLFSDSFTASLMDQAFAECAQIHENLSAISKIPGKCKNSFHAPSGMMEQQSKLTSDKTLTTPQRVNSLKHSPLMINETDSPTSNNSSRNDGSDCVPPTPPDENILSIRSPAFLTSLKKGGKTPTVKSQSKSVACKKDNATCHSLDFHRQLKNSSETSSLSIYQEASGKRTETNSNGKSVSNCENNLNKPCQSECVDAVPFTHSRDLISSCNDPDPVRTSQMLTQQSFTIIDVCAHKELFTTFLEEWKSQSNFALSLACEKVPNSCREKPSAFIGGKFIKKCSPVKCEENLQGLIVPDTSMMVVGLSVSWENRDAYYISLMESHEAEQDPDDSLSEPSLCESLSLHERIRAVCQVLNPHSGKGPERVNVYDAKTAYICFAKTVGLSLSMCQDPRVADWLKEQGGRLKNLHRMVITFLPEEIPLLEAIGGVTGYQGLGTDFKSKISGRIRACTESVLTMKLMAEYQTHLEKEQLWDAFVNTEMPSLVTLARMEMNGFGINLDELESQKALMTTKMEKLEQEAYRLAGHPFSLTSTDDIARVLYLELKLPINGDPECVRKLPARNSRRKCPPVGGTGKEILEKLQKYHVLPTIILEWRKISSALTKSLFALQKTAKRCDRLQMMRVFGDCQIFSATGRVSLAEPNIQNIPKDFAIQLPEPNLKAGESADILTTPVSMRKLFIPLKGGTLLGADYSQLELRIIAHLSGDKHLIHILNSDSGDVFKLIAAQMKAVDVCEVTPSDRQQAKQVCYGMLYGIGPKALGDQLGMCVEEASVFMETFKSKYPGVRRYLRETVEFCHKNGYVKTLFNRRRYLPAIKHTNPHARAHAERQAVNTSIQGSAADLVKKAMTSIDKRLMEIFPDSQTAHSQARPNRWSSSKQMPDRNKISKECMPSGAFFVLQLHDELIYEVSSGHVDTVARLVKYEMETAVKLHVKLPVKVKVGQNWSQLEDYEQTG